MFESQELVATNLLFEFVANEMQLFFDLLHIFFQDRNVFFQYGDIFFQFADCFERFVALPYVKTLLLLGIRMTGKLSMERFRAVLDMS